MSDPADLAEVLELLRRLTSVFDSRLYPPERVLIERAVELLTHRYTGPDSEAVA
jgi:hypothetical protein